MWRIPSHEPLIAPQIWRYYSRLSRHWLTVDRQLLYSIDNVPLRIAKKTDVLSADLRIFNGQSRRMPVVILRRFASTYAISHFYAALNDLHLSIDTYFSLVDLTFRSFEGTFLRLAKLLLAPNTEDEEEILLCNALRKTFLYLASKSNHIKGLTFPQGWTPNLQPNEVGSYLIWTTCLWRTLFADFFARYTVLDAEKDRKQLQYAAQLFADTHLDLFCAMFHNMKFGDAEYLWVDNGRMMDMFYPTCLRVCCVEELPDLGPVFNFINMSFDTGSKKNCDSASRAIAHTFVLKVMNQVCQIRHMDNIFAQYIVKYDAVQALLMLVIRVVLLGNLPLAANRPTLSARIIINSSFIDCGDGKIEFDNIRLIRWVMDKKFLTLFILREHFLYQCENNSLYDEIFSVTEKWFHFKGLIRNLMSDVRSIISKQGETSVTTTIDWSEIERRARDEGEVNPEEENKKIMKLIEAVKSGNPKQCAKAIKALNGSKKNGKKSEQTHRGKAFNGHQVSLETFVKLLKGRFEEIMLRKMISEENNVLATLLSPDEYADIFPLVRPEDKDRGRMNKNELQFEFDLTPDELVRVPDMAIPRDFRLARLRRALRPYVEPVKQRILNMIDDLSMVAFAVANKTNAADANHWQRTVIETRWLKYFGLSEEAFREVRDWIYRYYVFDKPDNGYKQLAFNIGKRSYFDFLLIKLYFKLVDYYRNDRFYILPVDTAIRQQLILRAQIALPPYTASPPALGKYWLCQGCRHWANPVVEAPLWSVFFGDKVMGGRESETDAYVPPPATSEASYYDDLHGDHYCIRGRYPKGELVKCRKEADLVLKNIKRLKLPSFSIPKDPTEEGQMVDGVKIKQECVDEEMDEDDLENLDLFANVEEAPPIEAENAEEDDDEEDGVSGKKKKDDSKKAMAAIRIDAVFEIMKTMNNCHKPLTPIDMVGIYKKVQNITYGLCNECACLTSLKHEKMTNRGLSCMNHPTNEFPVDHCHHLVYPAKNENPHAQSNKLALTRPHVLRYPIPCAHCPAERGYKAVSILYVLSVPRGIIALPLCAVDLEQLQSDLSGIGHLRTKPENVTLPVVNLFDVLQIIHR